MCSLLNRNAFSEHLAFGFGSHAIDPKPELMIYTLVRTETNSRHT
jgi:hypothetical protein